MSNSICLLMRFSLPQKVIDKENGGIEVTIYDMLNELKPTKT